MAGTTLEDVLSETIDARYVKRRVDEWKQRVTDLYATISDWLPDGWQAREGAPVTMHAKLMRKHGVEPEKMPTLVLSNGSGDCAKLEPRGLWIIPINGSVVLTHGDEIYHINDYAENFEQPDWQASHIERRPQHKKVNQEWLTQILR